MPNQPLTQPEASSAQGAASGEWRRAVCPICGANAQQVVLTGRNRLFGTDSMVSLARCGCGMLMTDPQPFGATLARFYATDAYYTHVARRRWRDRVRRATQRWQMRGLGATCRLAAEDWLGLQRFSKRLVPDHFPLRRGQRLLDYGCGDGRFVALCGDLGLDAIGIEPDAQARNAAEANGARVFESLEALDALWPGASFDRIQLKHVLEHLPEPVATLRRLCGRLAAGGRMLIAVPNADSAQAETFGEFWIGYDMPRHLWHFTPATLTELTASAGLAVVSLETIELGWFARESAAQQRSHTGTSPLYNPGAPGRVESSGRGAEIVTILAGGS
jgi:SAM-dependent methyltransferase